MYVVKTHADKIREALTDLKIASPKKIMDWVKSHYPEDPMNPSSYRSDIIGCSINHSSSPHYPSMPKFLWFIEDTKTYRLATSEEMDVTKVKTTKLTTTTEETETINGIPITKLSVTGQIQIPNEIRKKMNLKAGDAIGFIINENNRLELRKVRVKLELL